MSAIQIDGQRQPKPATAEPLRLRDPDILQLPQPLAFEISMSAFLEADGWISTERMDLDHEGRLTFDTSITRSTSESA